MTACFLSMLNCFSSATYSFTDVAAMTNGWMLLLRLRLERVGFATLAFFAVRSFGRSRHNANLLRRHRSHQRLEDLEALYAAQFCLTRSFRMGHHTQDVAPRTADS